MSIQSEAALEKLLIEQLQGLEYEFVKIGDEAIMLANLKKQLEIHNELTDAPLSEDEFTQIKHYLNNGGIFERAGLLRNICNLKRDDGSTKEIRFLNQEAWCKNEFQVANQITMEGEYENRYDVTILINGLPLVQIELKRKDAELKVAFDQINRYRYHSYDAGIGLFQYVQIFIISNGNETKYFANNPGQSFDFTFYWSDENNKRITSLQEFTDTFLRPCHIVKMIAKYIILAQEYKEESEVGLKRKKGKTAAQAIKREVTKRYLVILRPYQYYAVEAIVNKVKNCNDNGYIWHTTGSGKTLTSFKASQIIDTLENVEKVLFVVDRKDLDNQTAEAFNQYQEGSVDGTSNTKALIKQLADSAIDKSSTKLIVTTIQKLNNAVMQPKFSKQIEHLKNKKVVFIFDECHRSQFGETHQNIKKFFNKAQMFGFTGTPIFADNASSGMGIQKALKEGTLLTDGTEIKKTTKALFGECLHRYIITDAIRDGNVLPFSVEYIGQYKQNGTGTTLDIQVEDIDTEELFESEDRLRKITRYILSNHDAKTKQRQFTAMFCVSGVKTLIKYYDLFKEEQAKLGTDLTIATIFSYAPNEEDPNAHGFDIGAIPDEELEVDSKKMSPFSRDRLEEFIGDYNARFGTSYTTKDSDSFYNYYKNISDRTRNGEIDILLVVNMFLTGFDSKRLNTLYVDKNLKYHGLIQAYSRTNRIINIHKSHGQIVCFRNLKKQTDDAIALFASKDAKEVVLLEPYGHYVKKFNEGVTRLLEIVPDVNVVLEDENEQLEFVKRFRELLRLYNILKSFCDFQENDLLLTEQQMAEYMGKVRNLQYSISKQTGKQKVSILKDVDFFLDVMHSDEINVSYILRKCFELKKTPEDKIDKKRKEIQNLLNTSPSLHSKRELIEKFIEENLPKISSGDSIEALFADFRNKEAAAALRKLCEEEKLAQEKLEKIIQGYVFAGRFPKSTDIKDAFTVKVSILKMKTVMDTVTQKIKNFISTYVDGFEG